MIPPLHCDNLIEHEGHEWVNEDNEPVWCDGSSYDDSWVED